MNIVNIMGRLTAAPEIRQTSTGKNVCEITIAVSSGKDKTNFIPCQAWEKTAEIIAQYFNKGNMIAITGSLQVNNYKDKDGNNRSRTYVLVREITFCESRAERNAENTAVKPSENAYNAVPSSTTPAPPSQPQKGYSNPYAGQQQSMTIGQGYELLSGDEDDLPF